VRIARLKEGDLFGEMALIDNQLRSATAVAAPGTTLIVIPRKYIADRIDMSDKLVGMLLKVVLERYREMRSLLEHVSSGSNLDEVASKQQYAEHAYEKDAQFTAERLQAENRLKEALQSGELELFYQPIISLEKNCIAGCESLIRWRHPDRGLVSPFEFIGLAEETGLIVPIGLWIIEQACLAQMRFNELTNHPLYVSINLSGRQFESEDLVSDIKSIFNKTGVNPENFKLEITETLLMANPLKVAEILQAFKSLGSDIAIDDFGTGYSSLSYLSRFPFSKIKIDRQFIRTMTHDQAMRAIVKTIIALGRSLDVTVTAEGVETVAQAAMLRAFGCPQVQGFLYGCPGPAGANIIPLRGRKEGPSSRIVANWQKAGTSAIIRATARAERGRDGWTDERKRMDAAPGARGPGWPADSPLATGLAADGPRAVAR